MVLPLLSSFPVVGWQFSVIRDPPLLRLVFAGHLIQTTSSGGIDLSLWQLVEKSAQSLFASSTQHHSSPDQPWKVGFLTVFLAILVPRQIFRCHLPSLFRNDAKFWKRRCSAHWLKLEEVEPCRTFPCKSPQQHLSLSLFDFFDFVSEITARF